MQSCDELDARGGKNFYSGILRKRWNSKLVLTYQSWSRCASNQIWVPKSNNRFHTCLSSSSIISEQELDITINSLCYVHPQWYKRNLHLTMQWCELDVPVASVGYTVQLFWAAVWTWHIPMTWSVVSIVLDLRYHPSLHRCGDLPSSTSYLRTALSMTRPGEIRKRRTCVYGDRSGRI